MQPIFKELISMWKDFGYDLHLTEGIYWFDNHFVKAFTRDGELHKLYKFKVYDDLRIEIKSCNTQEVNESTFETWDETIARMQPYLNSLEDESISIIKNAMKTYSDYQFYILTSTGKDSMVTLDLVHKVNPNIPVIFNNTSLDCADTYRMVKAHKDWIITNPKEGFYQYIKRMNYVPNQISRGCCSIFKEGNSVGYFDSLGAKKTIQFMGVRNSESKKRENRQDFDHNPKWGSRDWYSCLPIRHFNDFDVWLYVFKYKLEINPKYKQGYKRVGCHIACPYQNKYQWVLDKYWYPTMRERWENILREDFIQNNRWVNLNCTIDEYVLNGWNGALYRTEPTKEVVKEFMEHKGITDKQIAMQYFNKQCVSCGKNVRQNDVLAMNLKMLGRTTNKIYCKKCLMREMNMTKEQFDESVANFKKQGCTLF